jgi:hypothetical protein
MIMKLMKETLYGDKHSSTPDTNFSYDESLSKLDLQCRIKDKFTQEIMEKVVLENQDNTLDDMIDYNKTATVKKPKSKPIPESTTITMTSVPTRKDKREMKKATKELIKFLNSPLTARRCSCL